MHTQGDQNTKTFYLSWLRVQFNNLAKLLNGDLSAKIGGGIIYRDLMDRKCNCYLPSRVNGKYIYEGKYRIKCLIYDVK